VVCDIDHFKQVNDRLGHHAGDGALEHVSEVLQRTKRRIDTAARIGGEEFALVLPETDEHGAYTFAERLRADVRRSFQAEPVALTISLGVASSGTHGDSAEELMHAAVTAELVVNREIYSDWYLKVASMKMKG
jgi:diguanylate cyclase (GGDEF)-like protein